MADQRSGHSLIIGGTGMLAKATLWLAGRSSSTILVSRHASRFAESHPHISPLDADWHTDTFRARITNALQTSKPVTATLLWLHAPAPTLTWLLPLTPGARVVVVLGSMGGRPTLPPGEFTPVRLGSKAASGGGRRWLTHEEICEGAIAALTDGKPRVVGELLAV